MDELLTAIDRWLEPLRELNSSPTAMGVEEKGPRAPTKRISAVG
jgi:hypothetical protein